MSPIPRGGKRVGAQGKAYPNRSDLNAQPVRTAPNQTYGVAGQQAAAQQQIPLPQQPPPGAGPPALPTGALPPALDAPTQRPGEPLTAGIAQGAGPGPEALQPPNPLVKAAAVLNALGDHADADTRALRDAVNATLNNQSAA